MRVELLWPLCAARFYVLGSFLIFSSVVIRGGFTSGIVRARKLKSIIKKPNTIKHKYSVLVSEGPSNRSQDSVIAVRGGSTVIRGCSDEK